MKKKILILPSWYPNRENPGQGTFFREQASLFTEDFEIRMMAGYLNRNIPRRKKLQNTLRFTLTKQVKVTEKKDHFLAPPLVHGFEYSQGLNKFSRANFYLMMKAYISYFEQSILPDWKPDLIHAHDTFTAGIIAHYLSSKHHIPYIITEHNYLLFDQPDYVKEEFIQALKNARHMLVVGEYQKRILLYRNIRKDVQIVGNYIDDSVYTLPAVKSDSEPFSILFVGRFAHHKDYDTLAETINRFHNISGNKDYHFKLIGTGVYGEKYLKERVDNSIYTQHCLVYPYVPREEIPAYFKNCDVLLSTSIAETFGVVTGEAMMCGKPVVSTNNGGFDEMFVPGMNGIKCAIGDAEALAGALLKVYKKEIEFDPVQIRESVLHKFGTEAFKEKMKEFYA